jgi:RHS repeat-associated protein
LQWVPNSTGIEQNIVVGTPNDGSYSWTIAPNIVAGAGKVKIYNEASNCINNNNQQSNTISITSIPAQCYFSDCNSPTHCGETTYKATTFEAVQYLCSHNIVSGVNGSVLPDQVITRAALAKIAFFGLYGDSLAVPPSLLSDYLPSPYNDLQNPSKYYFRAAKFLLYLQYGDSITPFDRNRANFYPNGTIKRIHALKVLFEAFNMPQDNSGPSPFSDLSVGSEGYGYAHWAFHHGITTETTFDTSGICTRAHAFIFLYRILNLINQGIISAPVPNVADFFIPGIYTPLTLAAAKSLETGNFNHYTKSSFSIPGRNVSMDFDHSYNSYLTEMPADLMPIQPLGEGWSHSYNSYILFIPADSASDERWMIYWPDGSIHSYKNVNGAYRRETEGIYDTLIYVPSNQFKIVTKNKITYTFTKSTSLQYEEVAFMLTSIKDRNDNTITISYTTSINLDNWFGAPKSTRKVYQVTDPANRTLTFYYTASPANLLTKVTDPLGRNIEFTHTNGRLSSFKDALNQTTAYNYYNYQQGPPLLKEIILPRSNKITNTYKNRKLLYSQANGNPGTRVALNQDNFTSPGATDYLQSTVTAPTGVVQKFNYNSKGKNTRIYGNAETDVTSHYNTPGQTWLPSAVTDNKSVVSASITYDSKGNPTHIQTTGGAFTVNESYEYNSFNDVTKYTNGRGHATVYEYNASGNLVKVTDPLNNSTSYAPNTAGQVTSVTTPSNVTTTYGYNGYGNLNLVSVPGVGSSSMIYDDASRLSSSTNFSGQTTTYLYDNNDNMKRETNALSYQTNSAYDANDNLSSITNAKGVPTTMTYDFYDRLASIGFEGANKNYTYYDDGSVKTFHDPNGHVFTYTYDAAGRIVTDGYATFTYDATTGNLQSIAKEGKTIAYGYDGLNRISTVSYSDFGGNTVTYTYDNNDNLASMKYPGNKTVTYTYDASNRLTQVNDWNGATTVYTYRPDGQLLTMTCPNSVKCTYSFDNAGRMTGAEYKRNGGSGSTIASYTFTLDNLGNHLQEQITEPYPAYPAIPNLTNNYTYSNANRIQTAGGVSFGYDNNGNTLSKTGYTYTYDLKNNLTGISGNYNISYEYDGLGNRRKKGNTRFVLDILGMSQVLMETDLSGNPQNYYVYGLGLISRISASNATNYYISDFRGSIVAITDATAAANITHQYQYDDFGKVTQLSEANFNPFRYVGKYGVMYEDSLNYFMRARYYDPAIGRFMSEDPVWSVNLYPYSNNNPLNNIDPSGLITQSDIQNMNFETLDKFIKNLKKKGKIQSSDKLNQYQRWAQEEYNLRIGRQEAEQELLRMQKAESERIGKLRSASGELNSTTTIASPTPFWESTQPMTKNTSSSGKKSTNGFGLVNPGPIGPKNLKGEFICLTCKDWRKTKLFKWLLNK